MDLYELNVGDLVEKEFLEREFKEMGPFGGSGNIQDLLVYIPKDIHNNRIRYLMKQEKKENELKVYLRYKV